MNIRRLTATHFVFVLLAVGACTTPTRKPPVIDVPPQVSAPQPAPPATSFVQHGKASYYADHFHGRATAAGHVFDQNALTAASKSLPFGTRALVTNLRTGKSVTVEVNDRGPFVRGRIIDLSKRAADEIGIVDGIARVKVEARIADQPTAELREKIARIAERRAATQRTRVQADNAAGG